MNNWEGSPVPQPSLRAMLQQHQKWGALVSCPLVSRHRGRSAAVIVEKYQVQFQGEKRRCEIGTSDSRRVRRYEPGEVPSQLLRVRYKCTITKVKQNLSFRLCDFFFFSDVHPLWYKHIEVYSVWDWRSVEKDKKKGQGDWMVSSEIWADLARSKGWRQELTVTCGESKYCASSGPRAEKQRINIGEGIGGGIFSVQVCFWKCFPSEYL